MESTTLGRSGLRVSRAALGTMNFGTGDTGATDERAAHQIVDAFLDAGGNLVDTADIYNGGTSEQVVGRAIAARRDEVVLATKAGGPTGPGENASGLSRLVLTRALDASLSRLGVEHVDLYQCHVPDPSTPIAETMATLADLVRAGKIRYIGCSNFTAAQIVEAQWAAEQLGGPAFVSLQPHYSLLNRDIEAEILPACARHGLGAITYGPLASGVLAARYRDGTAAEPGSRIDRWNHFPFPAAQRWAAAVTSERHHPVVDAVIRCAGSLGTSPAAVAIAWVARRPGVDSVILGPRTVEQLTDTLRGVELELPDECVHELDELSAPSARSVTGVPAEVGAA